MIIYGRTEKSKPKGKTRAEVEEYQKWLDKWSSPTKKVPLSKSFSSKIPILKAPPGRNTEKYPSIDTGRTGALTKTGIMRDYHKLSEKERKTVDDIAQCTAPLHKGNYVYVSPGMNPASLGRKNEVL